MSFLLIYVIDTKNLHRFYPWDKMHTKMVIPRNLKNGDHHFGENSYFLEKLVCDDIFGI